MNVRLSGERQVNVKSQSELDIGGRETCRSYKTAGIRRYVGVNYFCKYDY